MLTLCSRGCEQVLSHACRALRFLCSKRYKFEGNDASDGESDWEDIFVFNGPGVVQPVILAVIKAPICRSLVELLGHTSPAVQAQAVRAICEIADYRVTSKVRRQAIQDTTAVGGSVAFEGVGGCCREASSCVFGLSATDPVVRELCTCAN